MVDPKLAPDRRHFLAGAATLGAAIGLPELADSASAAEPADAAMATDFTKWLDSISGKHRQLYDAPAPNGGMPLIWSYVFLLTAPAAYAVPESDLGVVLVIRHHAIPFALSSPLWAKYKLGEFFKITDPATKAPSTRNFFVHSKPGDLFIPDASLDKLMARGVKVGACNMAITVYSGIFARQLNLPADQVKQEWIAGVVPGMHVVPSGVVAVNGAQSRGCAYCFAG